MERIQDTLEFRADEASSRLFDDLVDRALSDESFDVRARFLDEEGADEDSDPIPEVTINGLTGRAYARRLLEWTSTDEEFIEAASRSFEIKVARMWDDTMAYYEDLEQLGYEVNAIAMSTDSGYMDKVRQELKEQGLEGAGGDGEIFSIARHMVCTAVKEWADAIDAHKDAEQRVFGDAFSFESGAAEADVQNKFFIERMRELATTGFGWLPRILDADSGVTADLVKNKRRIAVLNFDYDTRCASVYVGKTGNVTICDQVSFAEAVQTAEKYAEGLWE